MDYRLLKLPNPVLYCFAIFCFVWTIKNSDIGFDSTALNLSYETVRRYQPLSNQDSGIAQRLPEAIIVGISKCGTRAILSFLTLHPGISFGLGKGESEVNFFNVHYQKGLEWYRKQMPLSRPGELTIEKSPRYFSTLGVPELIKKYNQSVKILVVACDPVFRFGSLIAHQILDAMKENRHLEPIEKRMFNHNGSVRETMDMKRSCYFESMSHWYSVFARSQLFVVNGDELRMNPYREMVKVEKFLGLKKYFTQSNFYYNLTKGFYCPAANGRIHCLASNKGRPHPEFSPKVKQALHSYYKECNKPFFDLIDRRFHWF